MHALNNTIYALSIVNECCKIYVQSNKVTSIYRYLAARNIHFNTFKIKSYIYIYADSFHSVAMTNNNQVSQAGATNLLLYTIIDVIQPRKKEIESTGVGVLIISV